jgi:hypothetical protein
MQLYRYFVSQSREFCCHNPLCCFSTNVLFLFFLLFISVIDSVRKLLDTRSTGWTIGVPGFDSRRGLGIFLFTTASRTVLEPTHSPIQWILGALSLGVKRLGREVDHSPPSGAEVKE